MRRIFIYILLLMCTGLNAQSHYAQSLSRRYVSEEGEGLEAVWHEFEGSVTDTSGNGYDFTNTGMTYVTSSPAPVSGDRCIYSSLPESVYFTLSSSYTNSFPSDFFICFWFQTPTNGTGIRLIQSGSPYFAGFNARLNTTGQDFDVFTNATELNANNFWGSSPNPIDVWFHVGLSYVSSTGVVEIYIDGVDKGGGTGVSSITLTNAWIMLNAAYGYMDDFRIFEFAAIEAEVLWIKEHPGESLTQRL